MLDPPPRRSKRAKSRGESPNYGAATRTRPVSVIALGGSPSSKKKQASPEPEDLLGLGIDDEVSPRPSIYPPYLLLSRTWLLYFRAGVVGVGICRQYFGDYVIAICGLEAVVSITSILLTLTTSKTRKKLGF